MLICGLQKLTLLDYPGRTACTVFTGGCNLRCPFCHNASLVLPGQAASAIDEGEVLEHLHKRRGVLDGVCVTGGEPLCQPDLEDFLRRVKSLGYLVKLDTNGTFPHRLRILVKRGLVDYVAMDIKNAPDAYAETVGKQNFDIAPVRESVDFLRSGAVPYEFRTTVVRELHTPLRLLQIADWLAGDSPYYLQAFRDSGNLVGGSSTGFTAYSPAEMQQLTDAMRIKMPRIQVRG